MYFKIIRVQLQCFIIGSQGALRFWWPRPRIGNAQQLMGSGIHPINIEHFFGGFLRVGPAFFPQVTPHLREHIVVRLQRARGVARDEGRRRGHRGQGRGGGRQTANGAAHLTSSGPAINGAGGQRAHDDLFKAHRYIGPQHPNGRKIEDHRFVIICVVHG